MTLERGSIVVFEETPADLHKRLLGGLNEVLHRRQNPGSWKESVDALGISGIKQAREDTSTRMTKLGISPSGLVSE